MTNYPEKYKKHWALQRGRFKAPKSLNSTLGNGYINDYSFLLNKSIEQLISSGLIASSNKK